MNYPDPDIVDLILNGFDLVGSAGGGRVLPVDFQPATLTVEELGEHSRPSNQAILRSTKSSGSHEVDEELWKKTLEEVDKGWLSRLDHLPQDNGRISRRFAVVQSGKVRPIDNYSESQVNNAVNILSKCTVDGVDTIAAMCAHYMKVSLESDRKSSLLGRSFDLKSAYRQLAVSDDFLKWARLAVYCPEDKQTHCFQQYSLPFGSKASVVGFLRCARLLQWLAHKLDLMTTCYFDDFVCVSGPALANNTEVTFCTLLDLLGWRYDKEGDKADQMSQEVSALGVVFKLDDSGNGKVSVENTKKRKEDLISQIEAALTKGHLSSSEASSLKGRLGFAEGQLFGRATRRLINELGMHALKPPKRNAFRESAYVALERVGQRLKSAAPRNVDANSGEVFYIFTDASFASEAREGGLGGVLLDQQGTVEIVLNCAIHACAHSWQAALSILYGDCAGCPAFPNKISYSSAINACANGSEWQLVLLLLAEIPLGGANEFSYSSAINACEKASQWQQALSLLEAMTSKQISSNEFTYSSAISACEKAQQWQSSVLLLDLMYSAGTATTDEVTSNGTLSSLSKGQQWKEAISESESSQKQVLILRG
eukprot:Skav213398  [mRNA]  locus=scaffold797:560569:568950:- [translate_table: standard]